MDLEMEFCLLRRMNVDRTEAEKSERCQQPDCDDTNSSFDVAIFNYYHLYYYYYYY